jgi:hypothetical protein
MQSLDGEPQRVRIERERTRRAAIYVSRHLIEQQDQREPTPRARRPRVELPARRALEQRFEFLPDLGIARRRLFGAVAAKPERRAFG